MKSLFGLLRFIWFISLGITIAWASLNPFVVANRTKVMTDQIVIPIPKQQLIQATSSHQKYLLDSGNSIILLLKPFETLYIVTDKDAALEAKISQDGRLFQSQNLSRENKKIAIPTTKSQTLYKFQNSLSRTISIKLSSKSPHHLSLYTTYIWSALNNYTPKQLELPAEKIQIKQFAKGSSRLAYRFKKAEKFSFQVQGAGTLRIGISTPLHPIESLSEQRKRISLQINNQKPEYLESLESLSPNTTGDKELLAMTYTAWHYRVLKEGENSITIETQGDICLTADIYKSNLVNSVNDSGLLWSVPDDFDSYNQAIWRNSNRDDALKRQSFIAKQKENIQDKTQKVALELLSKKSTTMKALYPTQIPKGTKVSHFYYDTYRLYSEHDYQEIVSLDEVYNSYNINKLAEGFFCEVPVEGEAQARQRYERPLGKLHFKERQQELNSILEQQLINLIKDLNSTEDIYRDKFTLSGTQNRITSVKKSLRKLGIEEDNIVMKELEKSKDVNIYREYKSIANNQLYYEMRERLSKEKELEITLQGDDRSEVYLDIDGKNRQILFFERDKIYDAFSFSTLLQSYREEKSADAILALLHNRDRVAVTAETAATLVSLPKGTKSIRLSRAHHTKSIKASLRVREAKVYMDTEYSLAHSYASRYKQFASSLRENLERSNKRFDAWYETTHSLRLWIESRIYQAENSINRGDIPPKDMFGYIEQLLQSDDRITAMQIAKHFLLLHSDKTMQRKAYQVLIKLSKDSKEASLWHSVYFAQTGSAETLQKIVDILRADGEYSLALIASLLLPRDNDYNQQGCELALVQNKMVLGKYLCSDLESKRKDTKEQKTKEQKTKQKETEYLQKKKELLSTPNFSTAYYKDNTKLLSSAGIETLYDNSKDTKLSLYRATKAQALKLSFSGPLTVDLDIRLLSPVTHYQWMKLKIDGKTYHYPLTQLEESDTLKSISDNRSVSRSNSLALHFDAGEHRVEIDAYNVPLAIATRYKKSLKSIPEPLEKQLLRTTAFEPLYQRVTDAEHSLLYLTALLWNYEYGTVQDRYNSQAKAWIVKDKISETDSNNNFSEINSILRYLTRDSRFVVEEKVSAPSGFYDMPSAVWDPQSQLQKNRTPLLEKIEQFDDVLIGFDSTVLHLQGDQNITLVAEQISPKYLVGRALSFAYSLDTAVETLVQFDNNKKSWSKTFLLGAGEHSLRVRVIDPISTDYLGVKIFENMQRVQQKLRKRYHLSLKENPITVYEKGPKLVKIEEKSIEGEVVISYRYLDQEKTYSIELPPSNNAQESYMRVYSLEFDPFVMSSKPYHRVTQIPELLSNNRAIVYSNINFLLDETMVDINNSIPYYGFKETWSAELSFSNQELGSDDDENLTSTQTIEVGIYMRKHIDEDIYFRQHYFARLYDNPLYALQNRLYTKIPYLDTWGMFEMNGYMQESDYWFTNLNFKAELIKKELLAGDWSHHYGGGLYKYFLDYNNPGEDLLDPLAYSRYRRDHQFGGFYKYALFYTPYDDMEYDIKMQVTSNEQLNIVDHLNLKLQFKQLFYPFDFSLYYDGRYYFEDRNRPDDYGINRVGGSVRYRDLFDTNRLQLEAGVVQKIENSDTQFSLQFIWHFGDNKVYENFAPDERPFHELRMLIEDERDYIDEH